MILVADIQREVAARFKVPAETMRQPRPVGRCETNRFDVSRPRQAAMALAVLLTEHSLTRIGEWFGGRDRTTVIHACRAVAKRRREDSELHDVMRRVTLDLAGRH